LIERKLVKWSREKISRCFYSFLRKLIFMRKDAEAEGEQRDVTCRSVRPGEKPGRRVAPSDRHSIPGNGNEGTERVGSRKRLEAK
jgi:hypothetical protein